MLFKFVNKFTLGYGNVPDSIDLDRSRHRPKVGGFPTCCADRHCHCASDQVGVTGSNDITGCRVQLRNPIGVQESILTVDM